MPTERRPRRSTPEVRRLVLAAARREFAEHGFAGATTNAIARRADVSERVLFRHFPTKRHLHVAAVTDPFKIFIGEFAERWEDHPLDELDTDALFRHFASDLYDVVCQNIDLVEAFFQHGDPATLAAEFERLDTVAASFAAATARTFDPIVSVRLLFLFIISAARYETLMFPDVSVTRERIVHELGEIVRRHATWPGE